MGTILETNQHFYEKLWSKVRLIQPSKFNTWPTIEALSTNAPTRLEVGPGMRPRLPIKGTHFADISDAALHHLKASGGQTHRCEIHHLPFPDNHFDLICALDIIEHVQDDVAALSELCRVAKPGAKFLLSVPLFMHCWTSFDAIVGHYRRYELDELFELLKSHHLSIDQSCVYGMQPKSNRIVDWAMNYIEKNPNRAFWYYNKIFMPIGLKLQKPLQFESGLCNLEGADEILLICSFK